jgi:hypothetical protein
VTTKNFFLKIDRYVTKIKNFSGFMKVDQIHGRCCGDYAHVFFSTTNKVLKWEKISGFYYLDTWATLFGTTIHNV